MIFHLNRFKASSLHTSYSYNTKNNDLIHAPDELDLTNYVINPDLPNAYFTEEELYQLSQIVRK